MNRAISRAIGSQFARPHGVFGKLVGRMMRRGNASLNMWLVDLLEVKPDDYVLEVGFGPGVALTAVLERASNGFVAGVDTSTPMVHEARARHADAIKRGRLDVRESDASTLPFADDTFDKAYATHVIYFWPDQVATVRELRRVLRPSGVLAIGFQERDRMPPQARAGLPEAGATLVDSTDVERILRAAGFTDVRIETQHATDGPAGFCALVTK